MDLKYQRILIKLSGEALAGDADMGINTEAMTNICEGIKKVYSLGVEIGIVVGGGNFWRGRDSGNMDRTRADHIGMLATVMNALALADTLQSLDTDVRVQTAIPMQAIAEPYIRSRAVRHMEKGLIVVFGCGTGSPYFSTYTAAALRAAEIKADVIFKATLVDAVYDKDPKKYGDAKRYESLTFDQVLDQQLGVMDTTAAAMCRDNNIPIIVFDIGDPENMVRAAMGEPIGTIVTAKLIRH